MYQQLSTCLWFWLSIKPIDAAFQNMDLFERMMEFGFQDYPLMRRAQICFMFRICVFNWAFGQKNGPPKCPQIWPLVEVQPWSIISTFLPSLIPAKTEELIVHSRSLEDNDRAGTCIILLCGYPLVIQHSYWKWPFVVDFPIENGDFP